MKKIGMFFLRIFSVAMICAVIFALIAVYPCVRGESVPGDTPSGEGAIDSTQTDEKIELTTDDSYTEMIDYIKNNIIPSVVAVISALGALYISVLPVINKVKNATDCFGSATKDVRQSTVNYNESQRRIEECIKKVEQMSRNCELEQQSVRRILEIAFCNSDELVSKGYAKKIAEIADAAQKGEDLFGEDENEEQNQTYHI